jgi:hypothetical protein
VADLSAADVPRNADGTPNLSAPAPRQVTGKPDFSGVWESRIPPSGRLGGPMIPNSGDGPPVATFVNAGRNMQGGLPYTPWAAELRKQRMSTFSQDNPDANCLPVGLMQQHTHSQPRSIVQTKDDLLIAYEANGGLRHIFLDGRPLPANDPQPWWQGYSVGRWDGDTLVVESTGSATTAGSMWTAATSAAPRSDRAVPPRELRASRARHHGRGRQGLHAPWTVRVNYRLVPDQQLIEFVCNENERSSKHYVARPLNARPQAYAASSAVQDVSRSARRERRTAAARDCRPSRRERRRCRRSSAGPSSRCTGRERRFPATAD